MGESRYNFYSCAALVMTDDKKYIENVNMEKGQLYRGEKVDYVPDKEYMYSFKNGQLKHIV